MKTTIKPTHRLLQNTTSRPVSPVPWDPGASQAHCPADWGPLLERYRKGDDRFFHLLCCQSGPLVDRISRRQYFANALGRDEAYSIAAMSMVSFWRELKPGDEAKNIPGLLYHAMQCDLLKQIDRQNTRRRREVHFETETDTTESDKDRPEPVADSRDEPEQQALQAEWNCRVRSCLQFLGKKEQQVIHAYFFRQLRVEEIAKELHCSPDSVTSAKRHALQTLRRIFAEQQII